MDTPKTTDRDPPAAVPVTGGAQQGGVKTPGQATHDGSTEEKAIDPSLSIEAINGEGEARPDRGGRAGGMIGEGAH